MPALLWLAAFWTSLHIAARLRGRETRRDVTPIAAGSRWRYELGWCTLTVERECTEETARRRVPKRGLRARLYDVGALAVLLGSFVALAGLAYQTVVSLRMLAGLLRSDGARETGRRIVKRAVEAASAGSASLLQPMIPGVSSSWSETPAMLFALLISAVVHEAGHASAALHCSGIAATSYGVMLLVALPAAFVKLPTAQVSALAPSARLRIATAGITHNVILVAVAWAVSSPGLGLANAALGRIGYTDRRLSGVVVQGVASGSPLAAHLTVGSIIARLDDVDMHDADSPLAPWRHFLESTRVSSFDSMGWCVDAADFDRANTSCCASPTTVSGSLVCFASGGLSRCLDLQQLLGGPAASRPGRCADRCTGSDVCVRPDERAQLVRLSVLEAGAVEPRIVLHQGPRLAIARDVAVGPLQATAWWTSQALPRWIDSLAGSIISISAALAALNMLPVPRLDGDEIVGCVIDALTDGGAARDGEAMLGWLARSSIAMPLAAALARVRKPLGIACAIAAAFSVAVTLLDGLLHRPR